MPDPRAKIESMQQENIRIAREFLTRPDLYPEGSMGREWAQKVLAEIDPELTFEKEK